MNDQLAIPLKPKWLAAASGATKAAWRILRGVVPVFLSREFVSHEKQRAEVDFVRHLMKAEAEAIAEVRAKLWRSFGDADPVSRLSIRRQLEQLDEDIRHLAISGKALDYIPLKGITSDIPLDAIPEHWMDRFLRLSRVANEPWRSDLLARALASQASDKDISPKLLWTIGTLDREVFEAVSYILDCSCIVAVEPGTETPLIPAFADALMDEVAIDYPANRSSHPLKFGSLIFKLQESGLIGEVFANSIDLHKPTFTFRYGNEAYKVTKRDGKTPITLPGLMVTDLGRGLAQFHSHTERIPGREFFERALELFSKKPFRKTRIPRKA
jgi:hypothetical protein